MSVVTTTLRPRGTDPLFISTMITTSNNLKCIERQTELFNPRRGWSGHWNVLQTIAHNVKRDHVEAGLQVPINVALVYQSASFNKCRSTWILPVWATRLGISNEKSKYLDQIKKLRMAIRFYVP
jgi:hypothetical protein